MQTLLLSQTKEIGWVQFHRPEVRNAVNMQMMEELEHVIDNWSNDDEIKIIIFRGDEHSFVSGGDVEQFHQLTSKSEIYPVMERMGKILDRIYQLDKITIAAVERYAVGGGCEIVTSCDFCLAGPEAQFGMIQVHLGITTGWGGGSRLLSKIGTSRGLRMLLTGERLNSYLAQELGLVDQVISSEHFYEEVELFAKRLAKAPMKAIQTYKQLARKVEKGISPSHLYPLEAESCSILWETEEHHQAVESFLQRTRRTSK